MDAWGHSREPNYLAWWERLRNVKLDGIKTDEKLLRDYTFHMDKKAVQKRAIAAVASSAVYDDIALSETMRSVVK
ncbi:MAG: hypothetical protein FWC98_05350 [Bacteroidales bacterium]|nr:hypothetical protein [Bacteroidales bacterium]